MTCSGFLPMTVRSCMVHVSLGSARRGYEKSRSLEYDHNYSSSPIVLKHFYYSTYTGDPQKEYECFPNVENDGSFKWPTNLDLVLVLVWVLELFDIYLQRSRVRGSSPILIIRYLSKKSI